ncbi:SixA phosphatase family protein [Solimicrobium silvestre]|uniref:Phosphohistidine phosphatase SixA n=1 Tax=Solimicrobium silvestre TaxID=2099400 RepID=A0A2S9GZ61_9BURK|nr:histidine phosphatase family protein [Solimicrobium silvestre]PRC93022.1 Phosphohistidine phosphatase SixA [Solimicrobium silvestre]
MDLILWRHAHAEALTEDMLHRVDSERKLTPKGQKQAAKMALWLDSVLPHSCKILVSPSQRTMQTALALGRKFKVVSEIGTDSDADQILAACNWPNSREPVLIIGHQPHLGDVVSKLIPTIQDCAIRKGNVWWISQKDAEDAPTTFLKVVMTPELVVK